MTAHRIRVRLFIGPTYDTAAEAIAKRGRDISDGGIGDVAKSGSLIKDLRWTLHLLAVLLDSGVWILFSSQATSELLDETSFIAPDVPAPCCPSIAHFSGAYEEWDWNPAEAAALAVGRRVTAFQTNGAYGRLYLDSPRSYLNVFAASIGDTELPGVVWMLDPAEDP